MALVNFCDFPLCLIISYRSGIAFSFSPSISLRGTAAWMVGSLNWGSHDGHRSGSAVCGAWLSCKYSKHAVFVPYFSVFPRFFRHLGENNHFSLLIIFDHFLQLWFARRNGSQQVNNHPFFVFFALFLIPLPSLSRRPDLWTDHVHGQNGRISLHAPLCLFKCRDFSTALWLVGDPWLGILDAEHHDLCGVGCSSMSPGRLRWYTYFNVFWRQIHSQRRGAWRNPKF